MINKKGISPLIATVLIIGFTIVAAVLVITWISTLVTESTEETACKTEASNRCIESIGTFTFSNQSYGIDGQHGVVLNNGINDADFRVVWLQSNGAKVAACAVEEINVPSFESVSTTVGCDDATIASINFIQEVTATEGNVQCEVVCGDGTLLPLS